MKYPIKRNLQRKWDIRLKHVALVLAVLSTSLASYGQQNSDYHAKISGHVKSEWTGEPLIGVNVYIESLKAGTMTDVNGFYEIRMLKGRYNIKFSGVGLRAVLQNVDVIEDVKLNIQLKESVLNLDEFTILSGDSDENISSLDVGKNILDIERINTMPSLLGEVDVIRSLILLPGVSTVGEGASGFNVRGGGVDQNLMLQDGALIFNPSHVFGFISVFNPAMVDNMTLYKSGIPAEYGGRLSSVLTVRLKEGDYQDHGISGGVGLVSSRLAVSGPIIKNKLSYNIGVRRSYLDWMLKKAEDINIRESTADFHDLNLKLSYLLNDKNKLIYSGYISYDHFNFGSDTTFNWGTQNHSLLWKHDFSPELYADFIATLGHYEYNINSKNTPNGFDISSDINSASFQGKLVFEATDAIQFNAGFQSTYFEFTPGNQLPIGDDSEIAAISIEKERSLESALFAESEYELSSNLSARIGVRYSHFANIGSGSDYIYEQGLPKKNVNIVDTVRYNSGEMIAQYGGLEPRISLNYKLSKTSSLKASYMRSRQYLHLISNTAASTPTDFWKTSNKYISPEIGDQYSLGYFKNFRNDAIEFSVEGYYKTGKNIVDFKDGTVILMNEYIEADLLTGTSQAYGLEFFVNKKKGQLTGWFSYTFSRTFRQIQGPTDEETINLGYKYPANYDKPHNLTIATTYELNPVVSFGSNFTFSTGRPVTVPLSLFEISNVTGISNFSLRNQDRIPNYHRLDLSTTFKSKPRTDRKWKTSWTFSVYNLYSRHNAYSIFFKNNYGVPPSAYKLTVLGNAFPSVMFNFEF